VIHSGGFFFVWFLIVKESLRYPDDILPRASASILFGGFAAMPEGE
jgi:hypothetical protein